MQAAQWMLVSDESRTDREQTLHTDHCAMMQEEGQREFWEPSAPLPEATLRGLLS